MKKGNINMPNSPKKYSQKSLFHGFTIVELLVTIVIIGILIAITVVSYMGVTQKAVVSSLQSDLGNAYQKLILDHASNVAYPTTLANADDGKGIPASTGTTYSYSVDNTTDPKTFCLNATNSGQSYKVTNSSSEPVSGNCLNFGIVLNLDAGNSSSYPGSGTIWTDLSGDSNNGSLVSGVGYTSANSGALVFDGVNDYVDVPKPVNSTLNFGTGSFTVGAWIKFSAYGGDYRTLIWNGATSGFSGWRFGLSTAGVPHILIGDTVTYRDADLGTTPVGLNAWHHLAVVFSRDSNAVAYVDGVNKGSSDISTKSGSINNISSINIGSSYTWFNGQISVVNIYNRALSSTEITQNFNTLKGRYGL